MKRVFVLASNAFAGGWFIDHCLNQEAEVIGISRSPEYRNELLGYATNSRRHSAFKFHQLDLNHDLEKTVSLIREFEPHYVVDFAGQGMVAQSWDAPHQWYQTNIVAKVKLHDQLRKMSFLERYLRFSTPEVYGSTDTTLRETAPLNPSTPYAVSHAAIDMSLKSFANTHHFPVILTRATNIYGPYQQLYRIIPRAMLYAKMGRKLKLDGGGHSVRNFVYMPDVSVALWQLLENGQNGEVYHIGSEEYVSIRQLVERIATLMNVEFSDLAEVGADRPGKDKAYFLNTDRIQHEVGWSSKTTLAQGLLETKNWIEQNFEVLQSTPLEYLHKE